METPQMVKLAIASRITCLMLAMSASTMAGLQPTDTTLPPETQALKVLSVAGSMTSSRDHHTATLLPNGMVLIAGGEEVINGQAGFVTNTAELYDPSSGKFTPTDGPMTVDRADHTATLMPNGWVLLTGGRSGEGYLSTAELYDPSSRTFTPTSAPMTAERSFHTATLMATGKILIVGGFGSNFGIFSAELYDPSSGTFTEVAPVPWTGKYLGSGDPVFLNAFELSG